MQSGQGDLLFQAIYAHTFNDRWAAGVGTRWMFPTASGDAFGDGKWQVAPIAGFRCFVPEISNGTFAEMALWWDNSFGGNPKRSNLQYLIIKPQFNLNLPHKWFVNSAPEIRSDYKTGKWFVPLDVMLGKKGEFSMGCQVPSEGVCTMATMNWVNDAQPIHRVYVDGFWMDHTDVTNEEFAKFVAATGYVTIAGRTPTKEEYPNTPPEALVAGSPVFTPPPHRVPLNNYLQWWRYVPGANWRHPTGPDSDRTGKENYPVVQVDYIDAAEYAKWAGRRLPTEAEWEFAARGGLSGKTYAWGDEFRPAGKWMANTYQGEFAPVDRCVAPPESTAGEPGRVAFAGFRFASRGARPERGQETGQRGQSAQG